MADDITLTVRVRDLTRGDFANLKRRLRDAEHDVRRVGASSDMTSERSKRLAESIRQTSDRMGKLSRTGNTAGHEMTFMRKTMSLLDRDLRNAAHSGELTTEQFKKLHGQLSQARLDFDYLDRDISRHNSIAQAANRNEMARQRAAAAAARQAAAEQRRLAAEQRRAAATAAADARRALAEQRRLAAAAAAAQRRAEADARRALAEQRRIANAAAAAQRRAAAEARRLANAAAAAQRRALAEQRRAEAAAARAAAADARRIAAEQAAARRRSINEQRRDLAALRTGGADPDLTARLRTDGTQDMRRSLLRLQRQLRGVTGDTHATRNATRLLNRDLSTMARVLRDAGRDGSISRRDIAGLATGLDNASRSSRDLSRSGSMTRNSYRQVTREIALMRAQLRLLGGDGSSFDRMNAHLLRLHRRIRDTRGEGNLLRRTFNRMADGLLTGVRAASPVLGRLLTGLRKVGGAINFNSRLTLIFLALLVLIGPAAQAIGAILITALGGAFLALGAFALRGNEQVKAAFKSMKANVGGAVREAAQPLQGALVLGMQQVGYAARGMEPMLKQAFTATAPLVRDLFGGITDLAAGALPGMTAALQAAGPAMAGFRIAMADVGTGLGDMFKQMTVGNEDGLARAWETLGNELQNLLTNIGEFIANMSKSQTATLLFIGIFRAFSGVLHIVEFAFKAVDSVFGSFIGKFNGWVTGLSGLTGSAKTAADSFTLMGQSTGDLKKELSDVNKEIAATQKIMGQQQMIPGPAGEDMREHTQDRLNGLLERRSGIETALAAASDQSAAATNGEAAAISTLIDKLNTLNGIKLGNLDKKSAMEQAIDDSNGQIDDIKKKYKDYNEILKIHNGELVLTAQSSRDVYEMGTKIITSTNDLGKNLKDQNAPWQQQIANFKEGRDAAAGIWQQFGLGKGQARALAESLLQIPDVQPKIELDLSRLKGQLKDAQHRLKTVPDSRKAQVRAEIEQLKAKIAEAQGALDSLHGVSVTVSVHTAGIGAAAAALAGLGNMPGAAAILGNANGGLAGFASGGSTQNVSGGGFLRGPGGPRSDSITAVGASGNPYRVSNSEFVVKADSVRKYGVRFLDALNDGRLKMAGFKKGGLTKRQKAAKAQSDAEKQARGEARGDLTISHFGRMAGYKNPEFRNQLALPNALGDLVGSLNHWRSVIMQATHGGVEKSLLKQLDKAGKALIGYEKRLSKINSSLDKAKTHLDDLRQSASSLRDSVSSGVMSATDVTQAASGDKNVTVSDIMRQMTESANKSSSFSTALKDLKGRGVSGDIIQQIAQSGISGGGLETAGAILGASDSDIQFMNSMQKSINSAAKSAGSTAADAMYGAGIKAAEGLVKGLTKKKKDIEKAMMNIAKGMERAIKKALGIHSPSRVMQQVGHYTAEGFAVGVKKNKGKDAAWASMLTTNSGSPSGGSSARSNGQPTIIQLKIGDRIFDEIWLDTGRRVVRTRGGNAQATLGRKTS